MTRRHRTPRRLRPPSRRPYRRHRRLRGPRRVRCRRARPPARAMAAFPCRPRAPSPARRAMASPPRPRRRPRLRRPRCSWVRTILARSRGRAEPRVIRFVSSVGRACGETIATPESARTMCVLRQGATTACATGARPTSIAGASVPRAATMVCGAMFRRIVHPGSARTDPVGRVPASASSPATEKVAVRVSSCRRERARPS